MTAKCLVLGYTHIFLSKTVKSIDTPARYGMECVIIFVECIMIFGQLQENIMHPSYVNLTVHFSEI